jgi:hypothetical protein
MNNALVSAIVAAIFLGIKTALHYKDPDMKAFVQDAGLVFVSVLAGIYGYSTYLNKPVAPKVAAVFTEQPAF